MKRIVLSVFLVLAPLCFFAQKADLEIDYTASAINVRGGNPMRPNQYVLIANSSESKFYSPRTEALDSLRSTPEGEAKYKEMSRSAFMGGKQDKIPRRDGSYYVIKSASGNQITTYDVHGLENYIMEESMPDWEWQISDDTKNILGYECQKAVTGFHGREWTVWFTPEIPLMNGPWKLGGLPGLILEAADQSGSYKFEATAIRQTSREITPVYSADSYDKIDRKEFLKAKRRMVDNPVAEMNAQLGAHGISISGDPNTLKKSKSREETDFIETDY